MICDSFAARTIGLFCIERLWPQNARNVWSDRPVLEAGVRLADVKSVNWPACRIQIGDWLASMTETVHRGEPGCVELLPWSALPSDPIELLGAVTQELQRLTAPDCQRGGWALLPVPLHENTDGQECPSSTLVIECFDPLVAAECLTTACRMLSAAVEGHDFAAESEFERLRQFAFDVAPGATTTMLMSAAEARGIPVMRLDRESLIQLGHGCQQRRLRTALTDRTSEISEAISDDKLLTKELLEQLGLPVPRGRLVRDAEDAWQAACELELPVVVKPRNDDYGHGVSLRLKTRDEVVAAYELARTFKPEVLVEKFILGVHHRLFVVGDRVVAAVRRDPAHVIGDGVHTIAELVAIANLDPRRGDDHDTSTPLWKIVLGDEERTVLSDHGRSVTTIPLTDERVPLRYDSRTSYGGTNDDVTNLVHPDVAAMVVDAVRFVGLDISGVDVIAEDIGRPLLEQGGAILEVNAAPSLLQHIEPMCDPPRPVVEAILAALFPVGSNESSRLPTVLIAGGEGVTNVARRVANFAIAEGRSVGVASRSGLWINERQLQSRPLANGAGARSVFLHPSVDFAVCEVTAESLRSEGLPCVSADAVIFLSRMEVTRHNSFGAKSVVELLAQAVRPGGVIVVNADEPTLNDLSVPPGVEFARVRLADIPAQLVARVLGSSPQTTPNFPRIATPVSIGFAAAS